MAACFQPGSDAPGTHLGTCPEIHSPGCPGGRLQAGMCVWGDQRLCKMSVRQGNVKGTRQTGCGMWECMAAMGVPFLFQRRREIGRGMIGSRHDFPGTGSDEGC